MKTILVMLFTILMLASCGGGKSEEVADINEDKFAEILYDLLIADAHVTYQLGMDMDLKSKVYGSYKAVFAEHGVSKESFKKAFDFYSKDVHKMQEIYAKVEIELSETQRKINDQKSTTSSK